MTLILQCFHFQTLPVHRRRDLLLCFLSLGYSSFETFRSLVHGPMLKAQKGSAELEDVSEETFVRFCQ